MLFAALAFGVVTASGLVTVDTGANLVFKVDAFNGDITSIKYKDSELQTTEGKYSQIASGLGTADVSTRTAGEVIIVSAKSGDLVQYYIARKGYDNIYMGTYAPSLPEVGELRFIARLNVFILPNATNPPDANVGTAIEGSDVFLLPDGTTSSKFYSARRMLDDRVHGVVGNGVGAYMIMGNRESSAGGPFFKDIATQKTAVTHELYNYMYSGHTQTGSFRGQFHGPYAIVLNDGAMPSADSVDFGFVDGLGLSGYVTAASRGAVVGKVNGVLSGEPILVGLQNSTAQYWGIADSSNDFSISGVKPGTYTQTLYQDELEVATRITVSAGATTTAKIGAVAPTGSVKWQIGIPDGTPQGFRNADKLPTEHPSDSRMSSWGPLTYKVGSSSLSDFPAAQWKGVNSPTTIKFDLANVDVRAYTLRIFVSLAQFGARPQIVVNGTWAGPAPAAPNQPNSRGVTRGTYRGNNALYEIAIPASALKSGSNAITINLISGSSGTQFLSPGLVYDSVQLIELSSASTMSSSSTASVALSSASPE